MTDIMKNCRFQVITRTDGRYNVHDTDADFRRVSYGFNVPPLYVDEKPAVRERTGSWGNYFAARLFALRLHSKNLAAQSR